jgi:hypothetical protein
MAKKLLKENTVRRFMKLASLGGLSSNFVNENFDEELEEGMYGAPDAHEEEDPLAGPTVAEGMHDAAMAHPADAHEEDEMPMGDEMPMDDEPLEAEEAPADDSPEDMARKAIEAVAAALGVEIDIASDAGEEAEELDLPAEEPLDEPLDEPEEDLGEAVEAVLEAAVEAVSEEKELEEVAEPVTEEEDITESVMNLLNKADIEVVDDETLREGLVRKVAARVIKRLIKDQA